MSGPGAFGPSTVWAVQIDATGWRDEVWARSACEAAEAAVVLVDRGGFDLALSGEPVRVAVRLAAEPAAEPLVFDVRGRLSVEYRAIRQVIGGGGA